MKNKEDEIGLLNKAIACLEEEVQAKNEIIRQLPLNTPPLLNTG